VQKELFLIPNWRISRIDVHLKSEDDFYKTRKTKSLFLVIVPLSIL